MLIAQSTHGELIIVGLDHDNLDRLRERKAAQSKCPGLPHVLIAAAPTLRDVVADLVDAGLLPASAVDEYVEPTDGTMTTWSPDGGTRVESTTPHDPAVTRPDLPDGYDPDERVGAPRPDTDGTAVFVELVAAGRAVLTAEDKTEALERLTAAVAHAGPVLTAAGIDL